MVIWYPIVLTLVGGERLAEIAVSRRNAAWTFAHGGIEGGRAASGLLVALHVLFLPACLGEALLLHRPLVPILAVPMLAMVAAAQALRWWSVRALGHAWNIRVLAIPGAAPVNDGPYRWLRHPNYLAVIAEAAALPLVHTAWATAIGFSVLNGVLIGFKIRDEEELLRSTGYYRARLGGRPALWPRLTGRHDPARRAGSADASG